MAQQSTKTPILRYALSSSTVLILIAAGTAFGAPATCVSAPLHGASQVVPGASSTTLTTVAFTGQVQADTDFVVVGMGKLVSPGTLGSMIFHSQRIYPDASDKFSATLTVRRDAFINAGIIWNDDDSVGFKLYEVKGTTMSSTPLPTYQAGPGYSVTKHGIAAVSDRADADKFPSQTSLGLIVTQGPPVSFRTEFRCSNASPLPAGEFKCPIPGDRFPTQRLRSFLSKKLPFFNDLDATAANTADVAARAAADRYYARFPAAEQHTTLANFKAANGFNADVNACKSDDPAVNVSGELCAWYRNEFDLGFGRQMHCRTVTPGPFGLPSKYACYVTNFKNENDAFNNTPLLQLRDPAGEAATVAMTWKQSSDPAVRIRYYAYSQTGARLTTAALDGGGPKAVPGLCLSCHGGQHNADDTVTGSHFLPFDQVSLPMASARPDQAAKIKELNRGVIYTDFITDTYAYTPITDLTVGWYDGFDDVDTYNGGYVPPGWSENPSLYLGVVAPYCRSCHIAQPGAYEWTTLANFQQSYDSILRDVCNFRTMPHAERTYQRFWESGAPAILATELGPVSALAPAGSPYEACKYKPLF